MSLLSFIFLLILNSSQTSSITSCGGGTLTHNITSSRHRNNNQLSSLYAQSVFCYASPPPTTEVTSHTHHLHHLQNHHTHPHHNYEWNLILSEMRSFFLKTMSKEMPGENVLPSFIRIYVTIDLKSSQDFQIFEYELYNQLSEFGVENPFGLIWIGHSVTPIIIQMLWITPYPIVSTEINE
jgi:hypothetical protein